MLHVCTQLGFSKIEGIGLFADQDINHGDLIWEYSHHTTSVYTQAQWDKLLKTIPPQGRNAISRFAYLNRDSEWELNLDDSRFMNHEESSNTSFNEETRRVFASRDIKKGEELTADYNEFDFSGAI